jgi:hypothetical protein
MAFKQSRRPKLFTAPDAYFFAIFHVFLPLVYLPLPFVYLPLPLMFKLCSICAWVLVTLLATIMAFLVFGLRWL